jgi:hypothetical protein
MHKAPDEKPVTTSADVIDIYAELGEIGIEVWLECLI